MKRAAAVVLWSLSALALPVVAHGRGQALIDGVLRLTIEWTNQLPATAGVAFWRLEDGAQLTQQRPEPSRAPQWLSDIAGQDWRTIYRDCRRCRWTPTQASSAEKTLSPTGAGAQVNPYDPWWQGVDGNWDEGSKWLPSTPTPNPDTELWFTNSVSTAAYTSRNNLGDDFVLNKLGFDSQNSSATMTITGQSLSFVTGTGLSAPTVLQNLRLQQCRKTT
jgi:hypothetical protein